MSKPFHFKQFSIEQDKCAMKVGTDGVLLGCFVDDKLRVGKVLDIGTGTGLLSLMMAQKFPEAMIEAVEVDNEASNQAAANFERSLWHKRLTSVCQSFQEFHSLSVNNYQLIVCNPPFYKSANKTKGNNRQHPAAQRAQARFADFLPFDELVKGVQQLLSTDGKFYVVLPVIEAQELMELCVQAGLYLHEIMEVTGREGAPPNRLLMCWAKQVQPLVRKSLLMYKSDTTPTEEYINFTREFYLWKKYDNHEHLKI